MCSSDLDADAWVPAAERRRWMSLPDTVTIGGEEYPLDYGVEDGVGIVRARIPEKALWDLEEADIPVLDRPVHWTVLRGKREAIRAATLEEAKELASRPRAELRAEGRLSQEAPLRGKRPERSGRSRGPAGAKGGRPGGREGGGEGRGPRKSGESESRGNRRRQRSRDKRKR